MLTVIIVIVIVGFLLWLVNTQVPMHPTVKTILNAVVVIVLVVWLMSVFGLIGPMPRPRV